MYHNLVAAGGLMLDIVGAVLIAVPDARILFSQFTPGALQEATSRLALGRVSEDDTGFHPLNNILQEIEPIAAFGEENGGIEYTEILVNTRTGFQSAEAAEHPHFSYGDKYLEARYEEDADCDETDFYNVDDVLDAITSTERPKTAQFRSFGMLFLLCGFTLQLLSSIQAPLLSVYLVLAIAGVISAVLYHFRERMG